MRRRTQKTKAKKPMSPGKKKFLTALFALAFTGLMTCFIIGCYILTSAVSTVNGERIIDLEFYKEHPIVETVSKSGTRRWLIFAYFIVDLISFFLQIRSTRLSFTFILFWGPYK